MSFGLVFDIREFTVHDGPGIRTTVFLKGCPLRCSWCHNPEGIQPVPQILRSAVGERLVGRLYTAQALAGILNAQAEILSNGEGGVTFSGGEPLHQSIFVSEVIDRLHGIHVLLDTSGHAPEQDFRLVAPRCQMVHFDIKLVDSQRHRQFTGFDNHLILHNLASLSTMNVPILIRTPLIPGVTDTDENLAAIAELASRTRGVVGVELLPYNRAAGGKYEACGRTYTPDFDEACPCNKNTEPFERRGVAVRVL